MNCLLNKNKFIVEDENFCDKGNNFCDPDLNIDLSPPTRINSNKKPLNSL